MPVSDRHEVSIYADIRLGRLLAELDSEQEVSQRALSRRLGIALGMTNLLLRRLAHKGLIRVVHVRPNRLRYLLTPTGLAEKARMTRLYLEQSIRFYAEARERLTASFSKLSTEWPERDQRKAIVFYGAGEVAEIGYICLQQSDLILIGVVDDERRRPFFGIPVAPSDQLRPMELNGVPFGSVVVMSLKDTEATRERLERAGFSSNRIYCL
jgi:DNA-binding MarR family transcriptional regulator